MPPRKKTKANSGKAVSVAEKPPAQDVPLKRKAPAKEASPAAVTEPVQTDAVHRDEKKKDVKQPSKTDPSDAPPAAKKDANGKDSKPDAQKKKSTARKRVPVAPIYDEIWKDIYLAGTEWAQMKDVYKVDWDFDHLDEELTEGDLAGKKVHLFGCTEPQLIMMDEKDTKGSVLPVPVIVAVVSDVPPPSTVGLKSVQRAEEDIVPMSKLRMEWHAYTPANVRSRKFKPYVHVLKCNERRARLRNMNEAAVHQYDYVLPYLFRPDEEEDVTVDTVVQVLAELEGVKAPLMLEFDYELDEPDEFVETTLEENELDAQKHTASLKKSIADAVKATKLKYKAEEEERRKRIEAISQEERDAIKNMKLIKFYPANDWPDVSAVKSKFVNRYYGQANEIL